MKGKTALLTQTSFLLVLSFLLFPASCPAERLHSVRAGESLSRLAHRYGVSMEEIKRLNGLRGPDLRVGQRLVIPEKARAAGPPVIPAGAKDRAEQVELSGEVPESHVVQKGETLARIARRYHLSVEELRALNGLSGKSVKPGQVLYLSPIEIPAEEEAAEETPLETSPPAVMAADGSGLLQTEKDRRLLARVAKSFLGARYTPGGNTINGMDCSAFVQKVFQIFDIDLPRTAREQFRAGFAIARNALKVGDLVFFKRGPTTRPTHVGIYLGNDQFIHTSLRRRQVKIDHLEGGYFSPYFMGAKRLTRIEPKAEEPLF